MLRASGATVSERIGHKCPACGNAVDSLRAGHVAIHDGRFQYFCNEQCKRELVAQSSGPVPSQVVTIEPPPIFNPMTAEEHQTESSDPLVLVPISATRPAVAASGPPSQSQADDPPATLPSALHLEPLAPATSTRVRTLPSIEQPRDARKNVVPKPATALPRFARVPSWVVACGAALGVVAGLVPWAGHATDVLRVPLAAAAVAVVVARAGLEPREVEAPHPALDVVPVLGGLLAVLWGLATRDPQTLALASFAGLAAACVLAGDGLASRASAPTQKARDRIARGLEGDVRVVRGGESLCVDPFEVKPGELVIVEAGETLGVDGIVVAGEAMVIPWLDAPGPVKKKEGDPLIAGATVVSGRLCATTTWAGADRAFFRLALSPVFRTDVAAPLTRGFRRVLERAVPAVAGLTAIAACAGGARGPLVLATACAVSLALAARGAARVVALHHSRGQLSALALGIIYKDAVAFDNAGRASVAVLCSRGTVLMGEPEIVALESLGTATEGRILSLAAGAEAASIHPFASAILRATRAKEERPENVRSAVVHAGLGVTALAATGERLVVGSRALLLRERISVAIADRRITELETQGRSVVLVALAGKLIGLVAMQDGLRPGARAAVQRLLDAKIEPVLLSGEARATCETIGRAIDIDHLRPEVLPSDGGTEVRALGEGGPVVAVIGQPQTDDAALGAADVSVALGAAGSTPGEWSVSLASDDVRDAARALSLAKGARDRSKVAMALGISPGVVAALALAWGVAPIWTAPLALLAGALAALVHARV
jgi:P-type Cu+ transporter